jgi:hypothetical protein
MPRISKSALRLAFAVSVLMLAGCTALETQRGWAFRNGPDSAMPATAIEASIVNQITIMDQFVLVADAKRNNQIDYYLVTLAGFNFIDEQCDAFLRELYAIDLERTRAKRGLEGAGLLAGAILQASPASKATIEIVAQAFGFAGLMTDTFANSYLINARPSTIFNVVSKLQREYQDLTERNKARLDSRPAAYAQIRGYLQLCMPVTIESQMNEHLVAGSALGGREATGQEGTGPGTARTVKLAR